MLNALIRFALTHRALVLAASILVLVYGSFLTTTLPIDVFPDLDRPRVVILTECHGLSSEEVETLVSWPIESALLGASGVQTVRSQSSQGLSVITIEFDWQTDSRHARQLVMERLATVPMPPDIHPLLTPPASIMGQIMHVGLHRRLGPQGGQLTAVAQTDLLAELTLAANQPTLTLWRPRPGAALRRGDRVPADKVDWQVAGASHAATFIHAGQTFRVQFLDPLAERMELHALADWLIRPRLLQLPGVAEVIVMGGDRKQFQVRVNPEQLQEFGVTLHEVEEAIRANNLNASGGIIVEDQTERPVRVLARLGPQADKAIDDLRQIPVKVGPARAVLLAQVAEVTVGPAPKRGDAGVNSHPGVVLTIVKQPHADTRRVTAAVTQVLASTASGLPADLVINTELFQLRKFIDLGIYYVEEALLIGAGLVVAVLFLFLFNLRTTFITLTAIPLSLLTTTLVFRLIEMLTGTPLSINVMTLGGLAVAMGELVDDAIVDVENIHRRLGENASSALPKPAIVVVYQASVEIRSAIVFGTAVVILAFAPLFALTGVEGRLFVPLGLAYITSILASLAVSLTVTPVLSYYLLPSSRKSHTGDSVLLRVLKTLATPLIRFSLRFAPWLLLTTWIVAAWSVWQLTRLGADFLPKFDEGSTQINVTLPSGSSLKASNDVAALIDARLKALQCTPEKPGEPILHFIRRTGRAERDEHAEPVSRSEYILTMNPRARYRRDEFIRTLLAQLRAEVPGVEFEAEQPLSHLISHMLSGVTAQIAVKVYGDDLDKLRDLALRIQDAIAPIAGVPPPLVDPQERVDEVHVIPRPDDLAFYGLSREYVAAWVQTALKGTVLSQVHEGQRRFDLVVTLNEPYRSDRFRLGDLRLELPGGRGQIRLRDVADVPESASGPNSIGREQARRRQTVRCNVAGRDLGSVAAEIEQRVRDQVSLPPGYFLEFGGQFEAQRSATLLIVLLAGASLGGIFFVLLLLFPSVRITLQVLNAIPTAFIGGVLALVLTQQTLTVASLVGFVSLGGIAVRNGILLVTHYVHLMRHEGEGFTEQMVLRGSLERLSPVLMTALTAGMGLLPIVLGGRKPGLEILYPVATVILGGLMTATFCEFLIHPGLFLRFSGRNAQQLVRSGDEDVELLRGVA